MKLGAIPGRRAHRLITTSIGDRIVLLTEDGVGTGLDRAVVRHRYRIGNPRYINIPPGRAILVRTVEITRPETPPALLYWPHRLRRTGGRATGQQQRQAAIGNQFERQTRHQFLPRASTSNSAS